MLPIYKNRYETLPLEYLIKEVAFRNGIATIRHWELLPDQCDRNMLFSAVLHRNGEIRARGYRVLWGHPHIISIYDLGQSRKYYIDKYGLIWPTILSLLFISGIVSLIWSI